jgi:threonine dehydrogenase-like Zn-dependent dehydrogenase
VAVIGCGMQGLLLVELALMRGARVLAADIHSERLAQARGSGAVDTVLLGSELTNQRALADVAREWSPSVVFEAAGSASAVESALQMVANGGSVVVVGLAAEAASIEPLQLVRRGLRLVGSLIYDHPADFRTAIDLVERCVIHPRVHVRTVVELGQAAEALTRAAHGQRGKTVVDVRGVLKPEPAPALEMPACDAR